MTQDLGATFRDLHRPNDPVLMPNPWDMGTAKLMKAAGAKALGTTSAGVAFTTGHPDGEAVTRDIHLAHAEAMVAATGLPISGDLENGYGDAPEDVAETIRLAADAGLAGCGIEDTRLPGTEPYPFDLAVERIRAAVAAARALPRDFVLTARTDVTLLGTHPADDAMKRLLAFADAGADCLFAPMQSDINAQKRLIATTKVPVNILAIGAYRDLGRTGIAELGAARISIGGGLSRVTAQIVSDATKQMLIDGDFSALTSAMPFETLDPILKS